MTTAQYARRTASSSSLNDVLFSAVIAAAVVGAVVTAATVPTAEDFGTAPAMAQLPTVYVTGKRLTAVDTTVIELPRVVVVGHRLAPVTVETAAAGQAARLQAGEI